jgi:hypothetical protein
VLDERGHVAGEEVLAVAAADHERGVAPGADDHAGHEADDQRDHAAHDAARGWTGSGPTSVVTDLGTYVFDPATALCALRNDRRSRCVVRYLDWRLVAGIATPFHEIRDEPEASIESRVVAVAYNLALPESLFAVP